MDLFYGGADKLGKNRTYLYLSGKNKLFSYACLDFNKYFLYDYIERKLLCNYILQVLVGGQSDKFILCEW